MEVTMGFTSEQKDALYWRYKKQKPPTEEKPDMNGPVKIVKPKKHII